MRPARGWSWEGSDKEEFPRKEDTSWAVEGSKVSGWKEVLEVGSAKGESEEDEDAGEAEEEELGEGFFPVRVPQSDISRQEMNRSLGVAVALAPRCTVVMTAAIVTKNRARGSAYIRPDYAKY